MHSSSSYQKYTSLILSLLLHVLLFLLFFMIKMHRHLVLEEEPQAKRSNPTKISYVQQTPTAPTPITPQSSPATTGLNPLTQPNSQATKQEVTEQVDQQEAQEEAESFSQSQAPAAMNEAGKDQGKAAEAQSHSRNGISLGIGSSSIADTTEHKEAPSQGKKRRRRSSISGAAFMNAFKQSLRTEREEMAGGSSYSDSPSSAVQERLEEWAEAHYIQSIYRALKKAARFSSKILNSQADIHRSVPLEIPIEKNGALGKLADVITGIEEADEHLKNILKQADFPPIPKRFNKDRFVLRTMLNVSLKKGVNYGYISVS